MSFRIKNKQLDTFFISTGNIEGIASADSPEEACSQCFNNIFNIYKESELEVGIITRCLNLTSLMEKDIDFLDCDLFLRTSLIFADIGKHNLSKHLINIEKLMESSKH